MMKFLLSFLIFTSFTAQVFAQEGVPNLPIDSVTDKITYAGVVIVDTSIKKLELYSRAREWFAKTYNSLTTVIQMYDKESGKIIGKAIMQVYCKSLGSDRKCGFINYTISVYFKDGRYKYEIIDFYHTGQYISSENVIPDYGACENWINDKRKHSFTSQKAVQKISNYFLQQLDGNIKALIIDLQETLKLKSSLKSDW